MKATITAPVSQFLRASTWSTFAMGGKLHDRAELAAIRLNHSIAVLKRLFDNPVFWRTLLALTLALLVATILIAPSVDLPWTVLTGSFASLTALLFLLTSIIPRASLQSEFRWIALAVAVAPERGPTGRATVLRC